MRPSRIIFLLSTIVFAIIEVTVFLRLMANNLAFSPDANMLASANYSSVYLWDLTSRRLLRKIKTHNSVQHYCFHQMEGPW